MTSPPDRAVTVLAISADAAKPVMRASSNKRDFTSPDWDER
jgi:hypothetical protein